MGIGSSGACSGLDESSAEVCLVCGHRHVFDICRGAITGHGGEGGVAWLGFCSCDRGTTEHASDNRPKAPR